MGIDIKDIVDPALMKYYEKRLAEYQEYEANIESLRYDSLVSIMGGVNYTMTFEEMNEQIKQTFEDMRADGLIITAEEFEKVREDILI